MTIKLFLIILFSVTLSALAQISLKAGMSGNQVNQLMNADGGYLDLFLYAIKNPFIILGLAMYGFGAIVWLLVLGRIDVSMAYPFVGIGFILTMFFGVIILNESLNLSRIIGTLLVVLGVVFISRS